MSTFSRLLLSKRHDVTMDHFIFFMIAIFYIITPKLPFVDFNETPDPSLSRLFFYFDIIMSLVFAFFALIVFRDYVFHLDYMQFFAIITLFFLGIAFTVLFSASPIVSFTRMISNGIMVFISFLIVVAVKDRENFSFFFLTVVIIELIINYLLILGLPSKAIHSGMGLFGEWRGIFTHKNTAAPMMAFFVIFGIYYARNKNLLIGWAIICSAAIFMIMTKAKGPILALILTILVSHLIHFFKNVYMSALLVLASFAFMAIMLPGSMYIREIEDFYLKNNIDATFTGRTDIWEYVLKEFQKVNQWFGFGFGAFWFRADEVYHLEATYSTVSWATNAHNTYFDMLVTTGYFGLGLFIFTFVIMPAIDLQNSLNQRQDEFLILFLFRSWLFYMLAAFNDSNMLVGFSTSFHWFLIIYFFIRRAAKYPI